MSAMNPYAPGGSGTSAVVQQESIAANDPYGPTPHLEQPKPESQEMVFPGSDDPALLYVFASPGYTSPKPQVNPVASAAAWCGAFSLFFIPGFLAVILGIIGLLQSSSLKGVGRNSSIGAIVAGLIGIFMWVTLWLLVFGGWSN